MDKAQNVAKPDSGRDYQPEVGMESRGMARGHSLAKADAEGKDKGRLSTQRLLEKILEKGNLNEAYKRVKKNDGSHGVDKMTVGELLPYL